MNIQSSKSVSDSSPTSVSPKNIRTNISDPIGLVTINETVNLTKEQNEVLKMVCKSYEMTVSEYMQQALIEAMRFDIEEGNFSDVLLEKLDGNEKKKTNSAQTSSLKDELDKLHKR
jgi:hypothetical protein